jgi:CheY-like chemotaxis protein
VAGAERRTGGAVLVIDDEPALREFIARVLRRAGYEPVHAADGGEALDRARAGEIAAVLCDYRLPTMTGSDVYEAILGVRPELRGRIAFMTGDTLDPDFAAFVRRHDLATLAKPFDIAAVRAIVDELVRERPDVQDAGDQSRG